MFSHIISLFRGGSKGSQASVHAAAIQIADIPRYPPFDRGLPVVSPDDLIETQRELIDRIERTAGLTPSEFRERLLPVIHNLARYIHLLPATNTSHHRGAGGLFRMALEIGLYSLQIANSTIFASRGTISNEAKFRLHPKWVYATFIAALCSDIYRPIVNMVVLDDAGEKWPQLMMPLYDWIRSKDKDRYFIVWNVQDEVDAVGWSQTSSAYLLNAVIPMSSLQYLNDDNTEIVATMTACVTGATQPGITNQLRLIVSSVRNKVIERDIRSNSERYGTYTVGSHLEPHLIDAMRRLVRKKSWEVNVKGARVWYSSEGLFVIWQPAAREIISLLTEDNQAGIPKDGDTLADIMLTSGIAQRNEDDGRYWDICVPSTMQIFQAVKINRNEVLFTDTSELTPISESLFAGIAEEGGGNVSIKVSVKSAENSNAKAGVQAAPSKLPIRKVEPAPKPPSDKPAVSATETSPAADTPNAISPSETVTKPSSPVLITTKTEDADGAKESMPKAKVATTSQVPTASEDTGKGKSIVPPPPNALLEEERAKQAEKLFDSLPSDVSDFLRAIVEDQQDGSSSGPVFPVDGGVAISTMELESHGQANFMKLITALSNKNWLWSDPEKPMRKMHDAEFEGQKYKSVIIKHEVAQMLGFKYKRPKKKKEGLL